MKIKEIKKGNINKVYLLEINDNRYIVRMSDFDNSFECKILEFLKEKSYQSPKIIAHFQLGKKYTMIYDYLDGDNPDCFDDNFFIKLANQLFQLHLIESPFTEEDCKKNKETIEKMKEYYDKAKSSKYLYKETELLKQSYFEATKVEWNKMKNCIIHSDVKRENMIQNKDELTLIDFGNCYIGSRVIDIIRVIMWFFIKDGNYNYNRINLFLREYFKNQELTQSEKENIDSLFIYCILYNLLKDIVLFQDNILTEEYIENNSLKWLDALNEKEKVLKIGELIRNA